MWTTNNDFHLRCGTGDVVLLQSLVVPSLGTTNDIGGTTAAASVA